MVSMNEFPEVMRHARVDLAGNISGEFSPEDWEAILKRAKADVEASLLPPHEAWVQVIRDFHRTHYWGFVPNYVKPKRPPVHRDEKNLGYRMLWYSFRSFLLTKVAIVWTGALYTAYGDPFWGYCCLGAVAFSLTNYGIFLYRFGGRNEKYEK